MAERWCDSVSFQLNPGRANFCACEEMKSSQVCFDVTDCWDTEFRLSLEMDPLISILSSLNTRYGFRFSHSWDLWLSLIWESRGCCNWFFDTSGCHFGRFLSHCLMSNSSSSSQLSCSAALSCYQSFSRCDPFLSWDGQGLLCSVCGQRCSHFQSCRTESCQTSEGSDYHAACLWTALWELQWISDLNLSLARNMPVGCCYGSLYWPVGRWDLDSSWMKSYALSNCLTFHTLEQSDQLVTDLLS